MLRLLLALAVTVVLGLASRLYPVGWFLWDRVLGLGFYTSLGIPASRWRSLVRVNRL